MSGPHFKRQRGMSLVELMVAMLIALLLLDGLVSLFVTSNLTYQSQSGLGQMQDDQRTAMNILAQVVQSAGYYGNVAATTATGAFPVSSVFTNTGQYIYGQDGGSGSDTLYLRFQSVLNDGVMDCLGNTNTGSGTVSYINAIGVANNQLQCSENGAASQTLAGGNNISATTTMSCPKVGYQGISRIKFQYGIDTAGNGSVSQYVGASAVSTTVSNGWLAVHSVRATVTMLYCSSMGSTPQQVNFSRVISLPNRL